MPHHYHRQNQFSQKCHSCFKCGSPVSFEIDEHENSDTSHLVRVHCTNPFCSYLRIMGTVSYWEPDGGDKTLDECVALWNENKDWLGRPVQIE